MRKYIVYFICLSLFFTAGFKLSKDTNSRISKREQVTNGILNQAMVLLKKRYKIDPIATNVAMPGGVIRLLGLDFQIVGPLRQERIREILINSAQELLDLINTNSQIKPYLGQFPFTIKNIDINLFILDSDGREINHPEIGIATISEGQLEYLTLAYAEIPKKISESSEPYEEALKILVSQGNADEK